MRSAVFSVTCGLVLCGSLLGCGPVGGKDGGVDGSVSSDDGGSSLPVAPSCFGGGVDGGGSVVGGSAVALQYLGVAPSVLGIKGSNINESAHLTFKVVDQNGCPVKLAPVEFTLPSAPSGVKVGPSGVDTDENGLAVTILYSGAEVGVVTVRAEVAGKEISVLSAAIPIRGARPSMKNFYFDCDNTNLGALYRSPFNSPVTVQCTVELGDRFSNPVGVPTEVQFAAESGMITASGFTDLNGKVSVEFTAATSASNPPWDVPPMAEDLAQWPAPRAAEPSYSVGTLIRNPRDMLVTLIAYTGGEEEFIDKNRNGQWDTGEQFVDIGEPLLDVNDNNTYEPGVDSFREFNKADGVWTPPNGQWDSNTAIWQQNRVLFTGPPIVKVTPNKFEIGPGAPGAPMTLEFKVYANDEYLNPLIPGTAIGSDHKVGALVNVDDLFALENADSYGFRWEIRRVGRTKKQACDGAADEPICIYRVLIYGWWSTSQGFEIGTINMAYQPTLAADGGVPQAEGELLKVSASANDLTGTGYSTGTARP